VGAGLSQLHALFRTAERIVGPEGDPYGILALRLGRGRPEDAAGRAFLESLRSKAEHGTVEESLRDHGYRPLPDQPHVWRWIPEAGT
jgi:hypothetical protein